MSSTNKGAMCHYFSSFDDVFFKYEIKYRTFVWEMRKYMKQDDEKDWRYISLKSDKSLKVLTRMMEHSMYNMDATRDLDWATRE